MSKVLDNNQRGPRRFGVAKRLADPAAVALLFTLLASGFFLAFPEVDLWITGLFYTPEQGFVLSRARLLRLFRETTDLAVWLLVLAILGSVFLKLARPEKASLIPPNVSLFLVSTLILGPGLLVNVLLKNEWGRPRPITVDQFGGNFPYVEVWRMSEYCARNCSFVSGEASISIWLTALAFVVPKGWRVPVAIVTAGYAVLISLNRIAFGGHFLSDVLISWGLTLLVIAILYRLFVATPPHWLEPMRLEEGMTRLGRALRGKSS